MHGLVVIEGMTLSGHPWIINEMKSDTKCSCFQLINPVGTFREVENIGIF